MKGIFTHILSLKGHDLNPNLEAGMFYYSSQQGFLNNSKRDFVE
jgi:hypothetical protein